MNRRNKTRIKRIIQLLGAVHVGDATGNQVFLLDRMFKELGCRSLIFAPTIDEPLKGVVNHLDGLSRHYNPDTDLLWMHYNLPSYMSEIFRKAEGKKILQFHNITPYEYFLPYNPGLAAILKTAKEDLEAIKDTCTLALGDSVYNCDALKEYGYTDVLHFPLIFDRAIYSVGQQPVISKLLEGLIKNIIFVGRVAPNKRLEDLLRCFAFIKKFIRDDCRLVIIGKYDPDEEYYRCLIRLAGLLRVDGVIFTGAVTQEELVQYYRSAGLFLSFSEHEGFFMPVLEAFHFGVPVIARDSAAVGETAGGAAMLFTDNDVAETAELAVSLLEDGELRNTLIRKGRGRVQDFYYSKAKLRLKKALELI